MLLVEGERCRIICRIIFPPPRMAYCTCLLLLLLALTSTARAERLPIKTYTTADGLPRDHINRIVQDSKGFLWFCTVEGLSRFDGYRFVNYGTDQGLPGHNINDFLESRSGDYWVATGKGLCRFNPNFSLPAGSNAQGDSQRFTVYYPDEIARRRDIHMLYEDHAGTIWCGTDGGLFRLDQINGQWVFSFVDIIPAAGIYNTLRLRAILEDRHGTLWISAESGLYMRRPEGVVEVYAPKNGLPLQNVLLEDQGGSIWVGTISGLYQLVSDPQSDRPIVAHVYTKQDGLADNSVTSLCQTASGQLWVGTGLGLSKLLPASEKGGRRFQSYTMKNGLSDLEIGTLTEDHDGNLWMGTPYSGAMRLTANGFASYKETEGLGGNGIASIFENRAGELQVLTGNGYLSRFNGGGFTATPLTLPKGITYRGWGWYQTMFQDSRGEWWMNTGQGLVRYAKAASSEQVTRARPKAIYTARNGLPASEIFRLYEDSRGDIWISTFGNPNNVLTRWERATETFHNYSPADGVPIAAPTAFCEDASGNLWIGFYLGGLLRYSQGRFTLFTKADGVPSGFVEGFYLDHAGRLWVATAEGGAARVDHPEAEHPNFITYTTAKGLSSNVATCVTEDVWGMIYIGTGRGVDKLDPTTDHVKHYTTSDGLASSFVDVAFRHRDGSLWFGTLQGLSRLLPQPERATAPPPILVSAFRVTGEPQPISELGAASLAGFELNASQNHIQIDFVGLSLGAGETLRYQFKLEGTNGDWTAPSDQRSVNYPNLPPGIYRFLVRAVSTDGTLSAAPAFVSFRVLPPIWQRWWVVLLALIFSALPFVVVARYRHQRMKAVHEAEEALRRSREERFLELEQVRRRIATDLHDDIGSSLSQIYLLSEIVRQRVGSDDLQVSESLTMISGASNEMVSSMSDIVWAINPQKDHLSDLIHRMRRFASDTFAACDIAFQFRAPDDEADARLGANIRREVFLIFKESVNNLVKHSGCTEAEIEFQMEDGSLLLRISDNGKGFDSTKDSDGHGLMSMRERATSLGGQFDLRSTAGQGTCVSLRVQLTPVSALPITTNTGGRTAT
jgi:ligand-binding sensor domain-containing protein/signal transduction histidine kinase